MKNLKKFLAIILIVLMSFNLLSNTISYDSNRQITNSYSLDIEFASNANLSLSLFSLDKRVIIAQVNDPNPNTTASAIVIIYSLDGQDQLGPYTITEGTLLKVDIDEREWGVRISQQSEGSEVTWWIEE